LVPSANDTVCHSAGNMCTFGTFNSNASSTFTESGSTFNFKDDTNTSVVGDQVADNLSIDGSSDISQVGFGLVMSGSNPRAVMGIGWNLDDEGDARIFSVVQQMSGTVTNRAAFSVYLNEYNATTGAMIFGGIDTTKYSGDLVGLPFQLDPIGGQSAYYVTLTSVSVTDHTGVSTQLTSYGFRQSALLRMGTSATLLNADVYQQLAKGFGVVEVEGGARAVPCNYVNSNVTINYQFGGSDGPVISVPISQIIGTQYTSPNDFPGSPGSCDFGIGPTTDGLVILGHTFLRSAYVVYDQDYNQAAIAQARYGVSSSRIIVIPSASTLPLVPSTATAVGTQLGAAATAFAPASTSAISGTITSAITAGTPTYNLGISQATGSTGAIANPTAGASSHSGSATGAPIGAIVGGVLGGLVAIIFVIAAMYCIRRRRYKRHTITSPLPLTSPSPITSPSPVPEKPEMYAGPVDQAIAGPVRPKQELQTQGTIVRKAVPPSTTLAKNLPETYSTSIAELEEHEKPSATYYPVASQELGTGYASFEPLRSLEEPAQGSSNNTRTTDTSGSTNRLLRGQNTLSAPLGIPSISATKTNQSPVDAALASEEADFAVQELGLISMRKRKLAEQAAAAGKSPEDMDGRPGEQYRELVEREVKLRKLLEEIHSVP
jgi:hypothetical protein